MPDYLSRAFSALAPNEKAMFLAGVVYTATISARKAYVRDENHPERDYEHPDGAILRDANNFVHRVTGYMMHVLGKTEMEGQDNSVMMMIAEHFKAQHLDSILARGLEFRVRELLAKLPFGTKRVAC
jgi:hypothetical protein